MRFADLLRNSLLSAEKGQQAARVAFPKMVEEKGMFFRESHGCLPNNQTLVILGFATWSGHDMALLDEIQPALLRPREERIEIFDAAILT